jgi:Chromo (CHRromatin Organisation MOdifier) domain
MLEPSTPNSFSRCEPTPDPPVLVNGELEYEISEILDTRIDKRCTCKLLYLVWWTGYEGTDKETSWLPASKLGHADEVILEFHDAYPAKPGPLSMLEVTH